MFFVIVYNNILFVNNHFSKEHAQRRIPNRASKIKKLCSKRYKAFSFLFLGFSRRKYDRHK